MYHYCLDCSKKHNKNQVKTDILSGLTVALALVPEAIAFSFIAQVSPIVGLYAAVILGLITAIMGGKPGMISGATGSVAVVMVGLVLEANARLSATGLTGDELYVHMLNYVLLATILAGAIQVLVGVLKFGKFIRLVPAPAIHGFVNGLAIVIFLSPVGMCKDDNWSWFSSALWESKTRKTTMSLMDVQQMVFKFIGDAASYNKADKQVSSSLGRMSKHAAVAGAALTVGVTAPLPGAAGAAIKPASTFNDKFTKSIAVIDSVKKLTQEQTDALRNNILKMKSETFLLAD